MSESITCPECGMTSWNPNDVRESYCGNCHDWTRELPEVRRRLRAAEDPALHSVADLTDDTLLWLLANHWRPPAAPPRRSNPATTNTFALTQEQYNQYLKVVNEAKAIKEMLEVEQRVVAGLGGEPLPERVAELRGRLRERTDQLKSMSESWMVER